LYGCGSFTGGSCGSAGCGKSLFALEFLIRGAIQFGEPGVLMSFEESADDIRKNVASLGFNVDDLIAKKKLVSGWRFGWRRWKSLGTNSSCPPELHQIFLRHFIKLGDRNNCLPIVQGDKRLLQNPEILVRVRLSTQKFVAIKIELQIAHQTLEQTVSREVGQKFSIRVFEPALRACCYKLCFRGHFDLLLDEASVDRFLHSTVVELVAQRIAVGATTAADLLRWRALIFCDPCFQVVCWRYVCLSASVQVFDRVSDSAFVHLTLQVLSHERTETCINFGPLLTFLNRM